MDGAGVARNPNVRATADGSRKCSNPTCVAREDTLAPGQKMLRCSRCKSAFYCSTHCQRTHWRDGHKKTCVAPVSATSAFGDDPAFDPAATMRVLRLEMGDAVAARGAPLLDASLFVVAKDLGKTLRFVDAHGLADPFGDDPDRCEFGPGHGNAHLDGPWVPWELMDETGEPRAGVHVPPWDCAYEGDQWLLLAYACAAEAHGPFHARAASVERMFATQQPRVTPEEGRVRARGRPGLPRGLQKETCGKPGRGVKASKAEKPPRRRRARSRESFVDYS